MMLVHPDNLKARVATHVLEAPVVLHVVYVVEEQHVWPVTHRLSQRAELQPPRAACRIEEHQRIGIAHFEEEFREQTLTPVAQPAIHSTERLTTRTHARGAELAAKLPRVKPDRILDVVDENVGVALVMSNEVIVLDELDRLAKRERLSPDRLHERVATQIALCSPPMPPAGLDRDEALRRRVCGKGFGEKERGSEYFMSSRLDDLRDVLARDDVA